MAALTADSARIPPGLRIYAIGDIHGRIDLLDALLEMILANERSQPAKRPVLIFLGDYIDRGPDSCGVVDRLIEDIPPAFTSIFLRGNHEEMMVRCFRTPDYFDTWADNGGLATAQSYGVEVDADERRSVDAKSVLDKLERNLPQAHRAFYSGLRISVTLGDYLFVHAGIRPGVPLDRQAERDCLFIRDEFLDFQGSFGKIVVHGHTPVQTPEIRRNRIAIDTGGFFTGRLTALCLEENNRKFLTTGGRESLLQPVCRS